MLRKIQEEIEEICDGYVPPWRLLSGIDEEYSAYVQNKDGNSFYYQWLALLVRAITPKLILELGTGLGVSTLMMFSELRDEGRLISCDVVQAPKFVPEDVRSDPRVKFYRGDDLDLNIYGEDLPVGIDVLFIDTEHTFRQVSAEWSVYKHLCNPGAIVVLDDIRMNDMQRFWDVLPYPKLELTEGCHFSGFGMFFYTGTDGPSPLNAYREALRIARATSLESKEQVQSGQRRFFAILMAVARRMRLS